MRVLPENIKVVAAFILRQMQQTFDAIGLASLPEHHDYNIAVNASFPALKEEENIKPDPYYQAGLASLVQHLPAVLYNAGVTRTIIPSSHIICLLQHNLLEVQIDDTGTFMLDVQKGAMYTFMWPSAETSPVSPPKPPSPVNLPKYRQQVKQVSELHGVYKGSYKSRSLVKGLLEANPMNMLKDMGTRKSGAGNLPGPDLVPILIPVMDILFNDPLKNDDLIRINIAQKNSDYLALTRMLATYNCHWGTAFEGVYLQEDDFKKYQQIHQPPGNLHYSDNFTEAPKDNNGNPYKYFIYLRTEDLKSEFIDFNSIGVILIKTQD